METISYGGSVPSYLGRFYDPQLTLPRELSAHLLIEEELARIAAALSVVLYAATLPRRLGGDATDGELAVDKLRCRRVGHALRQAHRGWTNKGVRTQDGEQVRQAGAQLVWEEWQGKHFTELMMRSSLAATYAVRTGDPDIVRWGKTAITNHNNERRWLTYALRD